MGKSTENFYFCGLLLLLLLKWTVGLSTCMSAHGTRARETGVCLALQGLSYYLPNTWQSKWALWASCTWRRSVRELDATFPVVVLMRA